ncbi:MAG: bile acid:sodium symporter family protein [Pseudomonadota bacterium]
MSIVTDGILPLALAFIMFSLGLGLTAADFVRVARQPKDFLVGAASQIVLLPAVALLLVLIWPMPPEMAVGVMIVAAAPGGVVSNILTSFARGDVALSISLTAIISLVSVITVPIVIAVSYNLLMGEAAEGDLSVLSTAVGIFVVVAVPVLIGMAVRHFAAGAATRFEPSARAVSGVLFVLVVIGALVQERENILTYLGQAGLIMLALNVVMMLVAYGVAKVAGSARKQQIAIVIECGLQNGTLAITAATLLFGGGLFVVPAACYSMIMFVTSLLLVYVLRRRFREVAS